MFHDVSLWSAAYGKRPSFCLLEVWLPSTMPTVSPRWTPGQQEPTHAAWSEGSQWLQWLSIWGSQWFQRWSLWASPRPTPVDPPRLQPHSFTQVLDQTHCRGGWCHVTALVTERKWKKNVEKWTSMLRKKHTLQQYVLIYSTMSCQNKRKRVQV